MNLFDITIRDLDPTKLKQYIPIEGNEGYILIYKDGTKEILSNRLKISISKVIETKKEKPIAIFKTSTTIKLQKITL